ncbi:MAG: PilZ domain-containing protein [Thermodesulfovibrionaceae bacterium]
MREFSRVNAWLPLGIRLLSEDEKNKVKSKTYGYIFMPLPKEEPLDKILAQWLKVLNLKLDYLINLITKNQEGFSTLPVYEVNISGGGMSFNYDRDFNRGDILELKTVLESPEPVALCLYGEVVNCEKLDKIYKVAVKFINIDEDIRDHIIKFVFHRQRQILREQKGI